MLFTDAAVVTQADLLRIESGIADVANEQDADIDLDEHIAFQTDEFADWILMKAQAFGSIVPAFAVGTAPGLLASNILTESAARSRVALSQICVTDAEYPLKWSPLKRCLVYQCIATFFRNASRRRDVDKYEEKWKDYEKEVTFHQKPAFQRRGVGVVLQPFSAPGATGEPGAGTYGNSNLTRTLSTPTDSGDPEYDVVVTWVDSNGYVSAANPANCESGPSARATIKMHAGDQIIVSIASLTAPDGTFRAAAIANLPILPRNTTGWNVYAGPKNGTLTLQNPSPIAYATKTKTLDATLLTTGQAVGYGQYPHYYQPLPNLIQRG